MKDSSGLGIDAEPAHRYESLNDGVGVLANELAASATWAYPQQPIQTGPNTQFGQAVIKGRGVNLRRPVSSFPSPHGLSRWLLPRDKLLILIITDFRLSCLVLCQRGLSGLPSKADAPAVIHRTAAFHAASAGSIGARCPPTTGSKRVTSPPAARAAAAYSRD